MNRGVGLGSHSISILPHSLISHTVSLISHTALIPYPILPRSLTDKPYGLCRRKAP